MLEIMRAYGQERLAEAGERDELRAAHARYFTGLAEASQDHLLGAQQVDWLRRLADDQDNLHAAIRGAVSAGDAGTAVRLAAALCWYWSLRSMKIEGSRADRRRARLSLRLRDEGYRTAGRDLLYVRACSPRKALQKPALICFRRATELAALVPDPFSPIMPLFGPLSRLFLANDFFLFPVLPRDLRRRGLSPASLGERDSPDPALSRFSLPGLQQAQAEADFLAVAGYSPRSENGVSRRSRSAAWPCWRAGGASTPPRSAISGRPGISPPRSAAQKTRCSSACSWCASCGCSASARRPEPSWRGRCPDAERLCLPEVVAFAAYTSGDLARLDGDPYAARSAGPGRRAGQRACRVSADSRRVRHRARLPG